VIGFALFLGPILFTKTKGDGSFKAAFVEQPAEAKAIELPKVAEATDNGEQKASDRALVADVDPKPEIDEKKVEQQAAETGLSPVKK